MKNNNLKPIPRFKNEDEERAFWDKADTTEYFDTSNPIDMDLSRLKPSTYSHPLGYLVYQETSDCTLS